MPKTDYKIFGALNPFFKVVLKGLKGLVDGEHYFDTFAEDAIFESRYHFPGWPSTIRGRANLMASLSGYGNTICLQSGDKLRVHRLQDIPSRDLGVRSARKDSFDWCAVSQPAHFDYHH